MHGFVAYGYVFWHVYFKDHAIHIKDSLVCRWIISILEPKWKYNYTQSSIVYTEVDDHWSYLRLQYMLTCKKE